MSLHPSALARPPRWFFILQSVWIAAVLVGVLWHAGAAAWDRSLIGLLAAVALAWMLHAVLRGGWSVLEALTVDAGALATATSVLGLEQWHFIAKPAAMVFAIAFVAVGACGVSVGGQKGFKLQTTLLLCALLGSLAGDVFLMLGGYFVPGLVSFLLAHLCYIALFSVGSPWLGHRGARVACLALGVGMYVFLWRGGLPPELRVPVAVYVLAISVMAAQAWARWKGRRNGPALWVALGACCFMLSDSLLATNRFVQPLPWAQLWVLASYYAAQVLIVRGVVRGGVVSKS